MADASGQPTPPPMPAANSRRRRWLKVVLWCVAVLLITAGVGLWIVTRSWFIIHQVQPDLERRIGGPVTIADASYQGGGRFVFRGVVVRAPGHTGPAGEVLRVDRVAVTLDTDTMIMNPTVRKVHVDGVRLRLSEAQRNPGVFSFMTLRPDWGADDGMVPALPPEVEIQNLIVELGVHNFDEHEVVGTLRLAGEMYPSQDEEHWINFALAEVDQAGAGLQDNGLHVKGRWNVETNEHVSRLDGLELNDRIYSMCPQIVREWWDRMDLVGRIEGASVAWQTDDPLEMSFEIEQVGLTIPIETADIWARYRNGLVEATPSRPRMLVSSGTITLYGDRLELDVQQGELASTDPGEDVVGVPYIFRMVIPSLPEIDWEDRQQWLADSLQKAPFEMTFELNEFSVGAEGAFDMPAVDLPRVVAEALERFEMTGWVLDTNVEVRRDPPIEQPDGTWVAEPEHWHGQAYIKNAACTYENFKYPLRDVEAFLKFDRDAVNLEYLYGYGSEHTRIRINGTIAPPSEQAAIDLKISAEGVPVDDQLRLALNPDQKAVFDALLHEPSFERLKQAELIPSEATVAEAQAEREALVDAMTAARRDAEQNGQAVGDIDAQLASMRLELERLNRVIEAGPFALGGHVDLDLRIQRELGRRRPVFVTGKMTLHEGGLVYEKFPYPLHVNGGVFDWRRDRIVIVDDAEHNGVTFSTPGGGQGRVTGAVLFSSASTTGKVEPQLSIQVIGDRLNEALYAAIPAGETQLADDAATDDAPSSQQSARRSMAGNLLDALGLRGALDYNGVIKADDDGRIDFGFLVQVQDAIASPRDELAQLIGESGLYWPEGFDVEDVHADLWISRDAIELNALNGRHDSGVVSAQGRMNLASDPPKINMQVDFLDLPIGEYLVDLAPREGVDRARALWDRYQPTGSFDATLRYNSTVDESDPAELRLHPRQLSVMINSSTVDFNRSAGSLVLTGGKVHFDQLALTLACADRDEGRMLLNGSYGVLRGDENLELHGTWHDGQLASPIITEAMHLIGAAQESEQFRALQPAGRFDAEFSYRSPRGDGPADYQLVMHPDTVDVHVNDTAVQLAMEPGSAIDIQQGVVTVRNVTAALGAGTFTTSGKAHIGAGELDINLDIEYDGPLSDPAVQAVLPAPARNALTAIEFADGPGSKLRNAQLRLHRTPVTSDDDSDSAAQFAWSTMFRGIAESDDASFIGGVPFDRVNGVFEITVRHEPDVRRELLIRALAPELRVFENSMSDAEAVIELVSDDELVVRDFRSEMFGGAVAARATFGVGARRDYTADVSMVGVDIAGLMEDELDETALPYDPFSEDARRSGRIFASVAVQGLRGQSSAQTGRGDIRIADGRMARMPILLGLLQLMELMPPLSDSLNFADADFYIEGGDMVFENILVECPTLQLRGRGTMNLATMDVDVLFRSRGTLAIVGDIVGGISDQLYGIRVSGPLTDPNAELVPLPGLSGAPPQRNDTTDASLRATAASP